ncbi:Hypothetical predicted protein [Mytilus galloprovincialis]|nr:Hypothetical predicted protein [Mytilus galloprovincialis]
MVQQTSEKLLDSEIENVIYPIDPNSLSVEDTVVCEAGMVPVDYRCVPCSKGKYEDNGNCNLCDVGSYQDTTGSQRCHNCPDGRSTLGMGSINAEDCSDKLVDAEILGLEFKVENIDAFKLKQLELEHELKLKELEMKEMEKRKEDELKFKQAELEMKERLEMDKKEKEDVFKLKELEMKLKELEMKERLEMEKMKIEMVKEESNTKV